MAIVRVAWNKRLLSRWLTDICSITDPGTVTITAGGGSAIANPVTTAGVACRVGPAGTQANLRMFGEQLVSESDHLIVLATGTSIEAGWTVTWAGDTYAVVAVADAGTDGASVRALLRRQTAVGG